MDERARLAIGGSAVVATSAAVVLFVALSNAAALTDSPGTSIGESAVLVPSPSPTSQFAPDEVPAAVVVPPADAPADDVEPPVEPVAELPAPGARGAITVPAPDPVVVSPPASAPAPVTPTAAEEDEFVAASAESGSWAAAIEWAHSNGWDDERVATWIASLAQKADESRRQLGAWSHGDAWRGQYDIDGNVEVGDHGAVDEHAGATAPEPVPDPQGWVDENVPSWVDDDPGSTETPASAGPPAVPGSDPGDGSKKDRSRESPDSRD